MASLSLDAPDYDFDGEVRAVDPQTERKKGIGADGGIPDQDGDGLPNWWEAKYFGGTTSANYDDDPDEDELTNLQEFIFGTDPLGSADSDGDGLSDGAEAFIHGTDPTNPDSDGDGLPDGWEVDNGLDPTDGTGDNGADGDPDGDGVSNEDEHANGTDAQSGDSDGDGLPDGDDILVVDCEGSPPNEDVSQEKVITIPQGTKALVVRITVFSREYPRYTGSSSVYNDTVSYTVTQPSEAPITETYQVNSLHSSFGAGMNPGGNATLDPVFLDYSTLTASGDSTLTIAATAVNISDGYLGSGARIEVDIIKVDLEELIESANPMNKIPNDYTFPEPLPVENTDADLALPKRSGESAWDEVQIDRSHLILIASDSSANPDPTIEATWDVQPPSAATELKANATYSIFSEVGQVALTAAGEADFQLPVNNASYYKAWNVFIDDPHILDSDSIGKIILISQQRWNDAKLQLNVIAAGGGIWPFSYNTARTMLECFVGDDGDAPYAPVDDGTFTLAQGDVWYQWLTHKVGLNWSGTSATIPVRKWNTGSQFSDNVLTSPEFFAEVSEALGDDFSTLKRLAPGGGHVITFTNRELEYLPTGDGGSSQDLFYGIARARLNGFLVVTVGAAHADPNKVNIDSLFINLQLNDLIDFNYFNTPGNLGALLQGGWKKFDNTAGGAGNVYFTRVVISETLEPFVYEN